jgi:chitodextrinase
VNHRELTLRRRVFARASVFLSCLSGAFGADIAAADPTGLKAAYAFDEGTGTSSADASGNGNVGTLTNGPTWISGHTNGAVAFDGSDDLVSLPNLDVSASALTIMAWVRFSSFPEGVDQRIVSKANDSTESGHWWMLGHVTTSTPRLRFRLKTGSTTTTLVASSGDLATNTWYHAAAVYDGSAMKLYLNGSEVGSVAKTGAVATDSSVAVNIGRNPNSYGYLLGAADDVRIYERALSATEISEDMNTPVGGGASGDTEPPAAPSGLSASVVGSTQINLSWSASTDNIGVTGYRVERCQGTSCSNFAEVGTPSGTTFNDTGLAASTTYRYRVRAHDAVPNFSGYSSIVNATTQASGDTQAPTAPTALIIVASSSTEIDLAWTASTDNVGVTAYLVERCSGASCSNFGQIATPTITKFDNTSLTPSTAYSYRVRARDAANNLSSYSNTVSTETPLSSPDCE